MRFNPVPRIRARLNGLGLRSKLALSTALLTLTVGAALIGIVREQVRNRTRTVVTDELSRRQQALLGLQRRGVEQLLAGAAILSQAPTLIAAIQTARIEERSGVDRFARDDRANTVESELAKLAVLFERDLLILTDEIGRVFAAASPTGRTPLRGTDLSGMPALRRALDPTAPADVRDVGVFESEGVFYQMGVHPIVQGGYTVGALLLGQRLDQRFVADAQRNASTEVIVVAAGRVVAGTPIRDSIAILDAVRLQTDSAGATTILVADGKELAAAKLPLGQTQHGGEADLWLIQPFSREVDQLTARLLVIFAAASLGLVVLSAAGAAVIARSVLRPLERFVGYMRAARSGDGAHKRFALPGARTPPEVAMLADTFDGLMESLAIERRELERRTAELMVANQELHDEARERERIEHALHESESQLRQSQRLEAIGTLAGGIAHDFNNLLTVISGYTQLAAASLNGERAAADLRQVMDATDRASRLTQQLLVFSRKQLLEPAAVDLGELVRGLSSMIRPLVGERIDLDLAIEEELPAVFADRGQVEQVLVNLVVNARDAMADGGRLTIACAQGVDANGSPGVVLEVRDTGPGIPAAIRERIFEPFFTTKEAGKGTGLGLAMVYGIVKQSGGTVDVETGEGGTTFRISLPVADAPPGRIAAPVPADADVDGTETVLVVDDEGEICELARRTLEVRGYVVLTASDPERARRIARETAIDLVVTDVVMPRMSGPELVRALLAERPGAVVIYMSGYADEAIQRYELGRGRTFLRKPFTPAELSRTVRHALDSVRVTSTGSA